MDLNEKKLKFTEKIAICYTASGPTYRKSAREKFLNQYYSNDLLYYFVLTDDKSYFQDIPLKNFYVNELRDFYPEYPEVEKYETFIETTNDPNEYANKFLKNEYKFPFACMRFHMLQAKKYGLTNIAFLATDTYINLDFLTDKFIKDKNTIYNTVSRWYIKKSQPDMKLITDIIESKYNLVLSDEIFVLDEAARFYIFQDTNMAQMYFDMFNDIILTLYREDKMNIFRGWYAMNDEYINAAIYDAIGLKVSPLSDYSGHILITHHNPEIERFWMI